MALPHAFITAIMVRRTQTIADSRAALGHFKKNFLLAAFVRGYTKFVQKANNFLFGDKFQDTIPFSLCDMYGYSIGYPQELQPMTAPTILFVCTGNTCRSPMAEGIAQKWLDDNGFVDWQAISAGVFAAQGRPTSEETIKALSQRGISFEGTSKVLTEEVAHAATVVLCMSQSHLIAASQFTNSVELLDPSGDIVDPIGKDQSVYDALAEQMEQLIEVRLKTLTSEGV